MPAIDKVSLRRILSENLEPEVTESVLAGTSFRDAGVDSLDLSAILYDVASEAGAQIDDEQVAEMKSVRDILEYFSS